MRLLPLLLVSQPAFAAEILFQGDIRGGVAVDSSAVDVSSLTGESLADGVPLQIQIPTTAVVTEAFLILHAKPDGFAVTDEAVRINGIDLTFATLLDSTDVFEAYSLEPSLYGITSAGTATYQEEGEVESGFHFGAGLQGATLAVVYEDFTLNGRRHVVIATDNVSEGASILSGLPEAEAIGTAVVSYGITNECANDQSNFAIVNSVAISSTVGGSDDGPGYSGTCGGQDWNTLLTQGSFGVDDSDTMVGVDGDLLDGTPSGGTSTNSRLDDELYRVAYDGSGDLSVGYSDSAEDSQLTVIVAAFELDGDGDLIPDSADNCPEDFNPDQIDGDFDGIGDACADCVDIDGDGYGVPPETVGCDFPDEFDCDDTDAAISPGATEIWYDGIDQDCDGADDFDADGDGSTAIGFGGDDCDDNNGARSPEFAEVWYDGIDQDCAGQCDYDQDLDGCPAAGYLAGAGLDPECDLTCYAVEDVIEPGDCDDESPDAFPGGTEVWYDGVDQDCDGTDADQDGDGETSTEVGGPDCDDLDPGRNTTIIEIWYDGIDQDCDGNDGDRDGDGHDHMSVGGDDCNDNDSTINPDVLEIWYDGVDQNCDERNDYDRDRDGHASAEYLSEGTDCDDENERINPDIEEVWYDGTDQNCDGLSDFDQDLDGADRRPEGDDCDDLDTTSYPEADEVWYDGIDQNCDGLPDNDQDGDGFKVESDCDDEDPAVFPDMDGFDGCEPSTDKGGLLGLGSGDYKGGGCSQAPQSTPTHWFALTLALIGLRRRRIQD